MIIGTTKELKNHEYRVGLTPDNVSDYVAKGHTVYVETHAGEGANFSDDEYSAAGAVIVDTPAEVFAKADMIVKVKEPEPCEYQYLREGQILYTYLHLAANPELAKVLLERGVKAVAFETITDADGNLPCLRPMSQIAGRLSIQEVGIDAQVTLLDVNLNRLSYLEDIFGASVTTLYSTEANIRKSLREADLVIGSVLIPGASTPKLIRREHLGIMKKGAVIVDIAIDQGGCCESSHVTTHDNPVYIDEGIVHYCVGNMPGAVPNTSTIALSNATFRYGRLIAQHGLEGAMKLDHGLVMGLNIYAGKCANRNLADSLGLEYSNPFEA